MNQEPEHPFEVGDLVELTQEAISATWKPGTCTPHSLWEIGWPNRFQVVGVAWHGGEPVVAIDACCRWMVNRASGAHLCGAHKAGIFRKIPAGKAGADGRRAERKISLSIPGLDPFTMDYYDDEQGTEFVLQGGSQRPIVLGGQMARWMFEKLKEGGVL